MVLSLYKGNLDIRERRGAGSDSQDKESTEVVCRNGRRIHPIHGVCAHVSTWCMCWCCRHPCFGKEVRWLLSLAGAD
eukprot:812271-Amphidinium_carterae.1